MTYTYEDFIVVMWGAQVPIKKGCIITPTGRLEGHDDDLMLFYGDDTQGRLFVNIPVQMTSTTGISIPLPVLIYQTAPESNSFSIVTSLSSDIVSKVFLQKHHGGSELNLINLCNLLSKRPVSLFADSSSGKIPDEKNNPYLGVTLVLYDPE